MSNTHGRIQRRQRSNVPDGFDPEQVRNISSVLNAVLADVFALYLKTKNPTGT